MYNNALIYIANKVKEQFKENSIDISDQPLYSLDLNLIEHTQKVLKEKVFEMFLELQNTRGVGEANIKAIEEALKAAQDALPNSLFESLIKSILQRIQVYINAKGQYTKY